MESAKNIMSVNGSKDSEEQTLCGFDCLGLIEPLVRSIKESGYKEPTEIQRVCIPLLLQGEDVLGLAQTGSGKTAAFSLPFLQKLDLNMKKVQMLLLVPTRELAVQVAGAMNKYAKYLAGFRSVAIYGGQRYDVQLNAIKCCPQVVVATPGRCLDLVNSNLLDLGSVSLLVLDEADEMLRMGFIEPITDILSRVPSDRQTALFSATMPEQVVKITKRFMRGAKEVKAENQCRASINVKQFYFIVDSNRKGLSLLRHFDNRDFESSIVFVKTKSATLSVASLLEEHGYKVAPLNGDMTQSARERALALFKAGTIKVLVATDVAARGLDVSSLDLVVNYDIPLDSENYVHRVGRTGRAGRIGEAILFVEPSKMGALRRIERELKLNITKIELPLVKDLVAKRTRKWVERLTRSVEGGAKEREQQLYASLKQDVGVESDKDLALALLKFALKVDHIYREDERDFSPVSPSFRETNSGGYKSDGTRPRRGYGDRGPSKYGRKNVNDRASDTRGPRVNSSHKMTNYAVSIGRDHGLEAKHLVGALIHEGGLTSHLIGSIKLFGDGAQLELSNTLKRSHLNQLSKIRIFNRPLGLQPL